MTNKKEALENWRLMMCARMYIGLEASLPDTNWTQCGDCVTPDGVMKTCDECRYFGETENDGKEKSTKTYI